LIYAEKKVHVMLMNFVSEMQLLS